MASESPQVIAGYVHAKRRMLLAALCCATLIAFIVLLAQHTSNDPLHALRDLRFTMWGVCLNFAVCLGSALAFGLWVRRERAAARR